MEQLFALAPIAVPALFWAGYHYYKDRALPEPPGYLALTFVLGMAAAGLSASLYRGIGLLGFRYDAGYLAETSVPGLLAYSMLVIGPVEEVAKLVPFLLVVLRFREFDETIDGIIYASFIGLGYAAVENWQYLDYLTTTEALARGFASPVIHILFASIWGYPIARAHIARQGLARAIVVGAGMACLLHGTYDFLVILNPRFALPGAAIMIVAIWIWRLRLLRDLPRQAARDQSDQKRSLE